MGGILDDAELWCAKPPISGVRSVKVSLRK